MSNPGMIAFASRNVARNPAKRMSITNRRTTNKMRGRRREAPAQSRLPASNAKGEAPSGVPAMQARPGLGCRVAVGGRTRFGFASASREAIHHSSCQLWSNCDLARFLRILIYLFYTFFKFSSRIDKK